MADLPSAIGRYEIISRLGQGGMGSLYLAKDPKIGRLVAIKLVRQEFDSPDARQRFAREAQSAGTLRHTNIVTIFDVDEHEGLPYIAMEYVDGETLSEIVRRKAPYAVPKRLQWIEELCSGLAYAHRQGVVHRDVKPANLMLDNEGTLKILDFGLARRETSKFTQSQTIIGTPNYMSPEQIRAGDVGPKSDIFAVGAVLYEVVAYAEAFPGSVHQAMHKILYEEPKPLDQILPNIDRGLAAIVARALEKDVTRRYQDLSAMKTDLATVRQRLENQVDEIAQTIVQPTPTAMRRPTVWTGSPAPHALGTPASGGSRRVSGTRRVSLQNKREEQIKARLSEAQKAFDAGDLQKAQDSCEQALMFDPDYPSALQLADEIGAEIERRKIAEFLTAARAELQQGRLDKAEQIVAQALEFAPQSAEVQQLRETIDTTRREIERARQIQDMLRRARARFSEGSFEGAIRAVGELLAIDPDNTAARDLQVRAQEAIQAREKRAERDAAAQAVVTEARVLFDKGDKDSAIRRLEGFAPPHDLVTGFLASLRGEQVAEEISEHAVSSGPGPATAAFMPGRSDTGAGVHVGTGSRTPVYAGVAIALVVLLAIGTYVMTRTKETAATDLAATNANAVATSSAPVAAAAPALPPPAVVTPPASLTDTAPKTDNDRDAMIAYKLLSSGQHVEASKVVAQIAKRDPKDPNLPDLRTQIKRVADAEKERAAAAADAAAAPANPAPPPAATPAPTPAPSEPAKPAAAEPVFSVLPGAGFAATSEPPPPPKLAELERPGIQSAIDEYAKALSAQDLRAVSRVRTLNPQQRDNWVKTFSRVKSYKLVVRMVNDPEVEGTSAKVPVEERVQQVDKNGFEINLPAVRLDYKMEKIDGKWRILPPS